MNQFQVVALRRVVCDDDWSAGCSEAKIYPLDRDLARTSLEEAMQAWIDGQTPQDLQPGMYVNDPAWQAGKSWSRSRFSATKTTILPIFTCA